MSSIVKDLFRYPVKSMGGERLERLFTGENGVPGDRAWAVRDEERGGIRGAKRFADLMQCKARYVEEPAPSGSSPAEIELPSGRKLMTTDDRVADVLSEFLDSPVSFWPLLPPDALDHYRRGGPVEEDMEAELRRVFARTKDEPLPDMSKFPSELMEFESPPGTYFDAYPLLVMTQQSLDSLAREAPESAIDVRRFRPNILLDYDSQDPYPEFSWEGKKMKVGGAMYKMELSCPRCQMTTHPVGDLPKDSNVMRTMVRKTDGNLGIYASVLEPGEVGVGDVVEFID